MSDAIPSRAATTIFDHHWRVIDPINGRRLAGFATKAEAVDYWAALPHPEYAEVIEYHPEALNHVGRFEDTA